MAAARLSASSMVTEMSGVGGLISSDGIWQWLADVPDPEIPVVSVVDLGIVRSVQTKDGAVIVTITPTYSGCPATSVIALDIEAALKTKGCDNVKVETQIAPPWTTAWISEDGRQKLLDYGIVPPVEGQNCAGMLAAMRSATIACPRCASTNTECVSPFGSTPCKASYRCTECLEPFDYFKPI